jgi:hypothetical protein
MNTLKGPIRREGAVIGVLVGLAEADCQALRSAGKPVPAPQSARALIDIGADASCASGSLLAPVWSAQVMPLRFVFANLGPAGNFGVAAEYATTLTIVHPSSNRRADLVLRNQPVIEQALDHLEYQVIIGRDILARCLLVYDGRGHEFTLAY